MMHPCKNMHVLTGKTVPLVLGAGGKYVDAVWELNNLMRVDPVPAHQRKSTPLFRVPSTNAPLRTSAVRDWTKALMHAIGEDPSQFGTHSYRIGGATALFAAGADPTVIRTMGRWSSDCYRLYVRACHETMPRMDQAGRLHDGHGQGRGVRRGRLLLICSTFVTTTTASRGVSKSNNLQAKDSPRRRGGPQHQRGMHVGRGLDVSENDDRRPSQGDPRKRRKE